MIQLYAEKNRLTVRQKEMLTSGSVNVNEAEFRFSEDWDGLTKTAVFRGGDDIREVLLCGTYRCQVPWEVLARAGADVYAGVYGSGAGGEIVLPTVWAYLGTVMQGAAPGENARPPTPGVYDQILGQLSGKADGLGYTESGELGLFSGDKLLESVPIMGGGEGGASDHRLLSHRNAPDSHPVEAITRLKEIVDNIPPATQRITNSELEELLK